MLWGLAKYLIWGTRMGSVHDKLWNRQTATYKGRPHGWIQWKGSTVCMDLHCACGESTHIHAEFLYVVCCGKCGRNYFVNGHIEMVPMTEEETVEWNKDTQGLDIQRTS